MKTAFIDLIDFGLYARQIVTSRCLLKCYTACFRTFLSAGLAACVLSTDVRAW